MTPSPLLNDQQPPRGDDADMPRESFTAEASAASANVLVVGVSTPAPASAAAPAGTADELDWDSRFSAIQSRLRHCVGEHLDVAPLVPGDLVALNRSLVQAIVLDCVEGLEQLHQTLQQQRGQPPCAPPAAGAPNDLLPSQT